MIFFIKVLDLFLNTLFITGFVLRNSFRFFFFEKFYLSFYSK